MEELVAMLMMLVLRVFEGSQDHDISKIIFSNLVTFDW